MGEALNKATDISGDKKIALLNSYPDYKLPASIPSDVPYDQMTATQQYEIDQRYAKLVQVYQQAQAQQKYDADVLAEQALKQQAEIDANDGAEADISNATPTGGEGQEQAGV